MGSLYLGLMHYPVRNKNGAPVVSAITNLDLHDIARACRTYGVARFFVVTPLADQQRLAKKILHHWLEGAGARYNPQRREALSLVRLADDLEGVREAILAESGRPPRLVATSSRGGRPTIDFPALRKLRDQDAPCLLLFGTAWGFTDDFIEEADHLLEPISGVDDYNHLSVRSAVAIILDRLGLSA